MPLPFFECLLSLPSVLQILFLLTQLNINILLGRNPKLKIIDFPKVKNQCVALPGFESHSGVNVHHAFIALCHLTCYMSTYTLCIFLTLCHTDASIGHLPTLIHTLKSDFSENTTFIVPPGTLGQVLRSALVLFCLFFSQVARNQC